MRFLERTHALWERVKERYRFRWWFLLILLGIAIISDAIWGWILARMTADLALDVLDFANVVLSAPVGLVGLVLAIYTAVVIALAYWETRPGRLAGTEPAPQRGKAEIFRAAFPAMLGDQKAILRGLLENAKELPTDADVVDGLEEAGFIEQLYYSRRLKAVYRISEDIEDAARELLGDS